MLESRRLTRRIAAAVVGGLLAAGALATGALASGAPATGAAAPSHPHPLTVPHPNSAQQASSAVRRAAALSVSGPVRYAVETPLCARPADPDRYRCFAVRRTTVPRSARGAVAYVAPNAAAAGPAGGYTPADLAGAYGYDPTAKVKQTIAIVDWYDDPKALADLNAFDAHYHLPKETKTSFRKVNQNGKTTPLPRANKNAAGEITLDIQSARAVCEHCRILLVEANGPSDPNLAQAENEAVRLGATEVSNSYGSPETGHKITNATVQAYNHPGVVITASTGDDGWYGWDFGRLKKGQSDNSAEFPSTSPAVVAVGGTLLAVQDHERGAEVVWNEDKSSPGLAGATGGGCSQLFAAAPWQKSYPNYGASRCQGARVAADVSAIADPGLGFDVYQTYGGSGWETVGGTSLAAPVTAAMWALAGGARGAAYPASALYVNAQVHPSSLYDITAFDPSELATGNSYCGGDSPSTCQMNANGNNPNGLGHGLLDCSFPFDGTEPSTPPTASRECNVAQGFDGPTGLGTPTSLRLFTATTPTLSVSGPSSVKAGKRLSLHAKAKEIVANTKVTDYLILWGDGTKSGTKTGAASHTYKKAGTHVATVLVADNRHQETIKRYRVTVRK